MHCKRLLTAVIALLTFTTAVPQTKKTLHSPNKNIRLGFWLNEQGAPMYELTYKNKTVILPSSMGFELKQTMNDIALPPLKEDLVLTASSQTGNDSKWKPVWGDVKEIREN